MTIFLSAENVCKQYGNRLALNGASLNLHQGETLALLGPNGAGKTTFIKILATLLTKDQGRIHVLGYDVDKDPEAIRHLVGYVGQDSERSAYARLNTLENLHFFGALRGMTQREIDHQIGKLSTYFDFHDALTIPFFQLSGGQKQIMIIMRALLHDPTIVYLDEPTKGLDPIMARRVRNFLSQWVEGERKSLLLTSHALADVEALAHRVALIHKGHVPVTAKPSELKYAVGVPAFIDLETKVLAPAIRRKIMGLSCVKFAIKQDNQWTTFGVSDPMTATGAIIQLFRQENLQINFRSRPVSMEDAFLHHFGQLTETFDR